MKKKKTTAALIALFIAAQVPAIGAQEKSKQDKGEIRLSSELVQIELYWSSPAGMLTNGAPIRLPSPGLESETRFEITVFSKRELDEALAFKATFSGKPKEALTELKAVVRVVRWDVAPGGVITGRKVLSNELSATLKIIE